MACEKQQSLMSSSEADSICTQHDQGIDGPCALRKKFVEGVQNAYKVSRQQPRDRIQVYEVQVNGLKNQAVAIFSTAGNASTFFCFTISPEGMLRGLCCLDCGSLSQPWLKITHRIRTQRHAGVLPQNFSSIDTPRF